MNFIDTIQGKTSSKIPFWFMRQAGRYLPEYKKVRSNFKNFLEFCYTPEAACEVTLQPIDRFDMSAAIIFSDILVIPDALGAEVWFEEKIGPKLTPITNNKQLELLHTGAMDSKLDPVYKAIRMTREKLPEDKALIGFCGSPWTLACYMVEGSGSRDFSNVRRLAYQQKDFFNKLINLLTEAIIQHASRQIEAGANVIQLFDSWSGVLSSLEFNSYVIEPTKRITAHLKQAYPHIPVIGFPRMSGEKMYHYAAHTKVDVLNFDHSISLDYAKEVLSDIVVLQGNLDSLMLAEDKENTLMYAKHLIKTFKRKPFIFNLAHGIVPHTPIENVQALCDVIKSAR